MLRRLRRKLTRNSQQNGKVETRRKMQLEALEPRILLSADLGVEQPEVLQQDIVPVAIGQPLEVKIDEPAQPLAGGNSDPLIAGQAQDSSTELVIVDSSLPDYQSLLDELSASTATNTEIHLLDAETDSLSQISAILEGRNGISALHIFSHGTAGQLTLGGSSLTIDTLQQQQEQLSRWGDALTDDGDILLYGCSVADGETGIDFIESLAELTSADVAASADATGTHEFGGDWDLEQTSGVVESDYLNPFNYQHLMFSLSGSNSDDSLLIDDFGTATDGMMRYSLNDGDDWFSFTVTDDIFEIDLGAGDDSLTLQGFDNSFTAQLSLLGGSGADLITVDSGVVVSASQILFEAEEIMINIGASLDATVVGSGDGTLILRAEDEGAGLLGGVFRDLATRAFGDDGIGEVIADYVEDVGLPIDYIPATTRITLDGAILTGSSVSVTASSTVPEQTLDIPFSLKVLVAKSLASVDVKDSTIRATGGDLMLSASSTVTVNKHAESLGLPLIDAAGGVTVVDSQALATITGTSTLEATGTINLTADNTVKTTNLADGTVGGMTQAGGVVAVTVAVTDTLAALDGAVQIDGATDVNVKATSSNTISTTAISTPGSADGGGGLIGSLLGTKGMSTGESTGAGTGTGSDTGTATTNPMSLAGSLAIAVVTNNTNAHINATDGTKVINGNGSVNVATEVDNSVATKADGSSTNTPSAVIGGGLAAAGNVIVVDNQAYLSGTPDFDGFEAINVTASMADSKKNVSDVQALSGASSGSFGASGAFALNVAVSASSATIFTGSTVDAGGADLSLEAINRSSNTVLATGKQEGTAGVGIGGSMALNIGINSAKAEIPGDVLLDDLSALSLSAEGDHILKTTAEAGGGGDVAVSPAIALAVGVNQTEALLPVGDALTLAGGLVLQAMHSSSQTTRGAADAAGASAGFGIGFGLTVGVDKALARLDRDVTSLSGDATVKAYSMVDTNTTGTASSAGAKPPATTGDPATETNSADSQIQEQTNVATGRDELAGTDLPSTPSASTSSGNISVAGALAVNIAVSEATAEITAGTSLLMQDGAVTVSTANDTDASATADASAVGSGNARIAPVVTPGVDSTITSGLALSFTDNAKADVRDSLNRSSGSWLDDGFKVGDSIKIEGDSGTDTLNGTYQIAGVTATTLTLIETAQINDKTITDASGLTINKVTAGTETAVTLSGALHAADHAAATRDSINRSTGSWSYVAGEQLTISGSPDIVGSTANNNKAVTVESVSADGRTLILTATDQLTTQNVTSGTVTLTMATVPTELVCSGPGMVFNHQEGAADSIVLNGDSWTANGYVVGDIVTVVDSIANDGNYTVAAISTDGTILTLDASVVLSAETATVGVKVNRHQLGQLNGSPQLTFSDVGASGDTIVRSGGSWVEDGFAIGDAITITGSGSNNNTYVIADIQDDGSNEHAKLVLADGYFLTDEANAANATVSLLARSTTATYSGTAADLSFTHHADQNDWITRSDSNGSWIKDGFAVGDTISVKGADSSVTNLTVTQVSDLSLTLTEQADLSKLVAANTAAIERSTTEASQSGTPGIGVGVAAAINVATVTNHATVAGVVESQGLTIEALMDSRDSEDNKHTLGASATSGAGAGKLGLAGSLAINTGITSSEAVLTSTSSVDAGQDILGGDVSLTAENKSSATILAKASETTTSTTTSSSVGGGASFALNVGVNTAKAEADGAVELINADSLSLIATGEHAATTKAEAGAGGKYAASGAIALSVGVNTTTANLPNGSALELDGGLTLQADHSGSATTIAKADTAGAAVGVGVGLGLNVEVDTAEAILDRSVDSSSGDVVIHAHTMSDSSVAATASVNGAKPADPATPSEPQDAEQQTNKQFDFATGQDSLQGKYVA